MTPDVFDWKSGRVTYWDLGGLDEDVPLAAQLDELKEDLAQVEYPNAVLLDVGWYPEFSEDGGFVVSIAVDQDWDEPIFRKTCADVRALRELLLEAIAAASLAAQSRQA